MHRWTYLNKHVHQLTMETTYRECLRQTGLMTEEKGQLLYHRAENETVILQFAEHTLGGESVKHQLKNVKLSVQGHAV